jgi:hypothetical protein
METLDLLYQEPQHLMQAWRTRPAGSRSSGAVSRMGFRERSSHCCQFSSGEPSLKAVGVLEPDFLHRFQGMQFCGSAAGSATGEPSL